MDIPIVNKANLEGSILDNRYKVGALIGKGAFGNVHKVYDKLNKKLPLAIKFSKDYVILHQEI